MVSIIHVTKHLWYTSTVTLELRYLFFLEIRDEEIIADQMAGHWCKVQQNLPVKDTLGTI